jgi:myo-inositol-1(or 4)-monophosphatase
MSKVTEYNGKYQSELKVAFKAVQLAGEYLVKNQQAAQTEINKDNHKNYATLQDLKSDEILISTINEKFPKDFILSEESSRGDFLQHERMWIIDPIDGTRNYANGLPYYAVVVALYEKGEVQFGVVYAPAYNNEVYYAIKGQGAYYNHQRISMLNPKNELADSIIATGFAYFKGKALRDALQGYEKVLENSTDVVRFGSAALDICHVATGKFGGYYEKGLKPWDVAASLLILEEIGGYASQYDGSDIDIFAKANEKFSVEVLCGKSEKIHLELQNLVN